MVSAIAQSSVLALAESHSRELAMRCRMLFDVTDLARSLTEAFRQTLARHHLTELGLTVLAVLTAHDALTPTELARQARMPRRTACHVSAQLELAGLLIVERDPHDRGRTRMRPTPLGRRACAGTLDACLDAVREFTSGVDSGQTQSTAATLARIRGAKEPLSHS